MTKILIADDHLIVRAGLKYVIQNETDMCLAGEAENGAELIRLIATSAPDLVITDIQMPGLNGLEAAKQIKEDYPAIAVIILSQVKEMRKVHEALSLGVNGYLLKDSAHDNLLNAIRTVCQGQVFLSPELPERAEIMKAFDAGTASFPWLSDSTAPAGERIEAFQKYMAAMPFVITPASGSDAQVIEKLTHLLQREKIHTNEKLTLAKVAVTVDVEPRRLSEVVVKYLGLSFPQLINWYRVQEALSLLSAEDKVRSIDVAFAAGFNTKSQYNLVFKNVTGLTPSEYAAVVKGAIGPP